MDITIEDIENILGTWQSSEEVTEREVAGLTNQDIELVNKVIGLHEEGISDENILSQFLNIDKERYSISEINQYLNHPGGKPVKIGGVLTEGKTAEQILQEIYPVKSPEEMAKKSKLKQASKGSPSKEELHEIAKILKDHIVKGKNTVPFEDIEENYIIGFAGKHTIGFELSTSEATIVLEKLKKLMKGSKLKETASKKSIPEIVAEEEKSKEEIQPKESMTHNPYYDQDEYVKINELAPFAAHEFINKGKMMNINKAVRGFRDEKGNKVIIYYNTKELQQFIDDYGIHATIFESRDELVDWLQKNVVDKHTPKKKK